MSRSRARPQLPIGYGSRILLQHARELDGVSMPGLVGAVERDFGVLGVSTMAADDQEPRWKLRKVVQSSRSSTCSARTPRALPTSV